MEVVPRGVEKRCLRRNSQQLWRDGKQPPRRAALGRPHDGQWPLPRGGVRASPEAAGSTDP